MGRKTFVSYMFRKGVDSELIRSNSGHKLIYHLLAIIKSMMIKKQLLHLRSGMWGN